MYTVVGHIDTAIEILKEEIAKGRAVKIKQLSDGNYAMTIK